MNYFAHAMHFLDRPYFMAGTGIPDWLAVADRQVRLRSRHIQEFVDAPDHRTAAVVGGVLQHIRDDACFHQSREFVVATLEMTVRARGALGEEMGLGLHFLGHLLVEILLDAALIAEDAQRLAAYYEALGSIDPWHIQHVVNQLGPRRTDRLALMISHFCQHRILSDYQEDARLMGRLNQVMGRVGLSPLPEHFVEFLPEARCLVESRRDGLLNGIPTEGL